MTDTHKRSLTLDTAKYQHYLDNSPLSDEEKQEFMQTMWNLVCEFVMLGFEVHPLQQACGKDSKNGADSAIPNGDMVK